MEHIKRGKAVFAELFVLWFIASHAIEVFVISRCNYSCEIVIVHDFWHSTKKENTTTNHEVHDLNRHEV